jgi:hypothetical protein
MYISNDYGVPDFLYINNKNGTFTNELEKCLGHISQFSMGNAVADINNDALPDIFHFGHVARRQPPSETLVCT